MSASFQNCGGDFEWANSIGGDAGVDHPSNDPHSADAAETFPDLTDGQIESVVALRCNAE
jgi:hypothetical protein